VAPRTPVEGRIAFRRRRRPHGHERSRARAHAAHRRKLRRFFWDRGRSSRRRERAAPLGGRRAQIGDQVTLTATTVDAFLAGPLLRASSWKGASGRLQLDADADLARVRATPLQLLFPSSRRAGTSCEGALGSRGARGAPKARRGRDSVPPPDVDFSSGPTAFTRRMASRRISPASSRTRFSFDGIDVQSTPPRGEGEHAALTARLIDEGGILRASPFSRTFRWRNC